MANENYEMEMMETENTELDEFETDGDSGKGLIPKLIVGGIAIGGAIIGGIAAVKAKKAKDAEKEGKPKTRRRLRWVEEVVETDVKKDEVIDVEAEVVDD